MEHTVIAEAVALIVAAALIAYACFRLGLVPIVGFLVAGVVIGPHALGLVRDQATVDQAAEIGVMFLLYTIGIEFSLEKLARIQRLIFGGGGLQVVSASLGMMAVLWLFGVDWRAGLFTGFLVALSSTAIVLKLLADRGETNAPHGQVGLGLLIFQDLAVIVMVLLVPMLAGSGGSAAEIAWALAKAGLIIAAVLLIARRVMPPVLEAVARTCSPELFLLAVIAICFGTAFLTNLAGVSLSLGAFLAGLVVSESRFSEHALGEILPLQILFSAAFFVSVGMLLDLRFLFTHLPLVLAALGLVLLVKVVTTFGSVRALGYPAPVAAASALMLAQVGEFSFVLERAGRSLGLSPGAMGDSGSQVFIAATVLLMVGTPLLTALGVMFGHRVEDVQTAHRSELEPTLPEHVMLENHVIVGGYGDAARRLVRVLAGSRIPFLITTLNPQGASEAEAADLPVLRGDASKARTLQLAGVEHAKMLVIADDDPGMARRIAAVARTLNPTMRIEVRTPYVAEVAPLAEVGVDRVVAEELESVVALFTDIMSAYRIDPAEIDANQEAVRREGYQALLGPLRPEAPVAECTLGPDCLDRRAVALRAGAPAIGQSLGALQLQARFAIHTESVRHHGTTVSEPPPEYVLEVGDELLLSGDAAAFAQAAPLFRTGSLSETETAALASAAERRKVDTMKTYELHPPPDVACTHVDRIRPQRAKTPGCEECLASGDRWVHLRLCMSCGHVGCCDSSPNKHATKHWHATQHPIMRSIEPGEEWGWCFPDEVEL
ncbi:MAG: cation:proton antiporter [Deltaproteobacteria bacterium]|nr:cation:proton antiporter [Deltaproteobacteria bacterium]